MFDKIYLFVITSIVYILAGMLGAKVAWFWRIRDFHSVGFWIFALIWSACAIIIVEYNKLRIRRKNK